MDRDIYQGIKHATNLKHVREGLTKVFDMTKNTKADERLGYISGIINSDGPEFVSQNLEKLEQFTKALREIHSFPVFSAVDILGNGMTDQLEEETFERELKEKHYIQFWRDILNSGHITDIFMTPRWEKSRGAVDEYDTAKKLGINIHYVDESVLLDPIVKSKT